MLGSGLIPESISAKAGSLELYPGLLRGWVPGAQGLGPSFAAFSDALSRKPGVRPALQDGMLASQADV